eukprot:4071661-Prymnesium_polylepis.1
MPPKYEAVQKQPVASAQSQTGPRTRRCPPRRPHSTHRHHDSKTRDRARVRSSSSTQHPPSTLRVARRARTWPNASSRPAAPGEDALRPLT